MSNEPIHFESFNFQANIFYNIVGLDAYEKAGEQPTGKAMRLRRQLRRIIFFITIGNFNWALVSEFMFIYLAFANNQNFVEVTMVIPIAAFIIVGYIKMSSIWRQRAHISAIMSDLYAIYPQTLAEQQLYDVKGQLKSYKRFAYAFIILVEASVWSLILYPLLHYVIYDLWLDMRTVGQTLPFDGWMPFDWHNNWRYYFVYIGQFACSQACVCMQLANDLLLCAVAAQLIMHYRQLARRIEDHVAGKKTGTAENQQSGEEDLRFLRGIIAYHQKLLNLSQAVNDVFGTSLFISFAAISLSICFILFQITVGSSTDTLVVLALFILCSLVQIFFNCYYAQELLEASENISHAIYNHNWYDADLRYKKMLVFIMQRAQKPAKLQASFSFFTVSMPIITELLQISFKGFAVIRTIYARQPRSD